MLSILRRIRGLRWGLSSSALFCVYRALILSGILYVAPNVASTPSLREQLERTHRAGLRVALGFPTYAQMKRPEVKLKINRCAPMQSTEHLLFYFVLLYARVQMNYSAQFRPVQDLRMCATSLDSAIKPTTTQQSPALLLRTF